nr:type IV secretory system conjugative DNA transfer family protein [Loktanella sp. M215]
MVIDPKGENARIAGAAREAFGDVFILDPFGVTGMASASYNPLDRLSADSLDLGDDASSLADALVIDAAGQGGDSLERRGQSSDRRADHVLCLP